jgi:transcriptional regulator with XRE-family HTH domain
MKREDNFPTIDKRGTGQRIKGYMLASKLTPKDIQEYLGLGSVQSVYHWLEGKSLPALDNLFALSVLLGVRVSDLLCSDQRQADICCFVGQSPRIRWYVERFRERVAS